MRKTKKVFTICYGKMKEWNSREDAVEFFETGMYCSEGSERERYTKIYLELMSGNQVATDEL